MDEFLKTKPQLYVIPLGEQMTLAERERYLPYIPAEKRQRLPKFRHWQDAQRTLLGYSLLSFILARETGYKRDKLEWVFDYYGKPHLPGINLHFNLSHSGDFIACAVSPTIIGTDVETIQPIDLSIAEHFFSPAEVQDLFRLPEERRMEYFFNLWTLKESYIKAEGLGVSIPLHSFSFQVVDNGQISFTTQRPGPKYCFKLYSFPYKYKLAACAEVGGLPEDFQFIDRAEIG